VRSTVPGPDVRPDIMATYDFCTLDVFTDRAFGGNPLAVVLDAHDLAETAMQSIAREFNYSETTFVLPAVQPAHTARVRIFTPGGELPFAGHPTVGTAYALAALGVIGPDVRDIVFEEGIGPVPVRIERAADDRVSRCTLTAAQSPRWVASLDRDAQLAAMLGIGESEVLAAAEVWSCGVPFLVVPLASVAALERARLDSARWSELLGGFASEKVYPVARAGADRMRVRMFAPGLGVAEDPATGSAAAALSGWLARHMSTGDGRHRWSVLQGEEMGRPSTIDLEYEQRGAEATVARVGGGAVMVTRGTLAL
jgi:trans-2,3-dihydro-3-hydroxyanthranilate isomerase